MAMDNAEAKIYYEDMIKRLARTRSIRGILITTDQTKVTLNSGKELVIEMRLNLD